MTFLWGFLWGVLHLQVVNSVPVVKNTINRSVLQVLQTKLFYSATDTEFTVQIV